MSLNFQYESLRFHFRAIDAIWFPPYKSTNILRGAFGTLFREIACVPECTDARTCPRAAVCAYARIFEPRPPGARKNPSCAGSPDSAPTPASPSTGSIDSAPTPNSPSARSIDSALTPVSPSAGSTDSVPMPASPSTGQTDFAPTPLSPCQDETKQSRDQRERVFDSPRPPGPSPSGLAELPRPFVFRAAHLDSRRIEPGGGFHFDVNLFDTSIEARAAFEQAFRRLAETGLGPGRGRAALIGADPVHVAVPLSPSEVSVHRMRVRFLSPTELKGEGGIVARPEFGILFARLRDRISTLRALYGAGPLELDFRAMGERARMVRMTECSVRTVEAERRSSRTGQRHPLGGFVGEAVYEGDLAEFVPYLRAGAATGVGRQTVWGKGEILMETLTRSS